MLWLISELGGLVRALEQFTEKYYEIPMKNMNGTKCPVTMTLYTPVDMNYELFESPIWFTINTTQLWIQLIPFTFSLIEHTVMHNSGLPTERAHLQVLNRSDLSPYWGHNTHLNISFLTSSRVKRLMFKALLIQKTQGCPVKMVMSRAFHCTNG